VLEFVVVEERNQYERVRLWVNQRTKESINSNSNETTDLLQKKELEEDVEIFEF